MATTTTKNILAYSKAIQAGEFAKARRKLIRMSNSIVGELTTTSGARKLWILKGAAGFNRADFAKSRSLIKAKQ